MYHEAGPSESGSGKFEKWKMKINSYHSSSKNVKWKIRAFTLFREVQSEKNYFHSFSWSEKWNQNTSRSRSKSENFENSSRFLRNKFLTELFCENQKDCCNRWLACNHHHLYNLSRKVKVHEKEPPALIWIETTSLESDNWECLSLTNWLTHSLTPV